MLLPGNLYLRVKWFFFGISGNARYDISSLKYSHLQQDGSGIFSD